MNRSKFLSYLIATTMLLTICVFASLAPPTDPKPFTYTADSVFPLIVIAIILAIEHRFDQSSIASEDNE